MSINIQYTSYKNYLSCSEWTFLIENYIEKIKNTRVGSILINNINDYINCGNIINIINYSSNKSFQYPSMSYVQRNSKHHVTICIPDTPYFTKVPIMSPYLEQLKNTNDLLAKLYSFNEVNSKIEDDFVKSFAIYEFQPIVVVLFHELVHALRKFKGVYSDHLEEEATMYGIEGVTLKIDNICITENTFRKELGLNPRLSHDALFLHVEGTHDKIENKSKEFWKDAFSQNKLKI